MLHGEVTVKNSEFSISLICEWIEARKELYIQSFKSKCHPEIRKNNPLTSDVEML